MESGDQFSVDLRHLNGPYAREREAMLEHDLWKRGIRDMRVLHAMARVPREAFIDPALVKRAYHDAPLSIGHAQTISQPYIVARMSELAEITSGSRVLEIGFGSGYQTAVLLELGAEVWGVELEPELATAAQQRLVRLRYTRHHLRSGDGFHGWLEAAPFDVILLAAAPVEIPTPLLDQLATGARLVAPIGPLNAQYLVRLRRTADGFDGEKLIGVRFVPMRGQAEAPPQT